MALTQRVDGTGSIALVDATWWNEYYLLLTGQMTDQPVTIANNLSVKGQGNYFNWNGTLNAANRQILQMSPTDAGAKNWGLFYQTSNALAFYNGTDATTPLTLNPDGSAIIGGALNVNKILTFGVYDGALATIRTVRVFIGTVDPSTYTTVNEGDIWIKG